MEKTIVLGKKKVKLRSTAATPLIYKNQFHKDFFADMMQLASGFKEGQEVTAEDIDGIDLTVLWNFVWALAKNANPTIPEPIEFFSRYESLELETVMPQIQDLLVQSLQTTKK
ncbi:MAG: hypothetical protein LKF36_11955 [Lactobacillus sp.]|jgi:hypothetical protein|nr:hypothetical protein [Lactobacillus sp.]